MFMKIDNKLINTLIFMMLPFSFSYADELLDDVIVTAKTKNPSFDTADSFSVVSEEDIKSMSATSIQEILREVVGVNIGVNDGSFAGRETLSIRGANSKHTLILIDGKRVSGTDAQIGHSNFQYNWLPINAIKKIEIIRGAMSSLYGSQAIGGVVNIITKQVDKEFTGSISTEFGESSDNGGDEKEISLNLGAKITDKLSLSLFAQKKDIEMTKNDTNSSFTSNREGKELQNSMINLWYDIDDTQQIKASYLNGDEKRDVILYSPRRGVSTTYDSFYDIDKEHYSLDYKKSFEDIDMSLKYYKTKSDSHSQNLNLTHKLEDNIFNAELDIATIKNHYIVIGAEHREESYHKAYDDISKKDFSDDIIYKSFYLQDEVEMGEKTLVTMGARYDKHEQFGSEFNPKLYIVHKVDKNSRIKAGYAEGFNAPTVTQGSSDYKVKSMFIISGDDNLKAEKSKSYEISYAYQKENSSITATLFHTKIKNLIATKKIGEVPMGRMVQNILKYANVDRAKMQGLELEIKEENIIKGMDVDLAYNYLKTKDETTNKALYARPNQTANLKLSYSMPYNLNTTLRVNYVGVQRDYENNKLSSYITSGIQLKKEFTNGITARVGVENISDKKLDKEHNYQLKGRFIYGRIGYKF